MDDQEPEPIHLRHSIDGWPLCWPMDREGEFRGTSNAVEVTCHPCLTFMAD